MALDTGTLIIELKAKGVKLTKAQLKQLGEETDKTTSGVRKLVGAIGIAGLGYALINTGKKAVQFAGKMEGLTPAFNNLGNKIGFTDQSLGKLEKALDGTVNQMDIMKQANNAMLLGIVDSDDQMAELFDTAQRLAKAVGEDATFGVESLVTGLGRQSKLMLDNLGIMVDTNKLYEIHADKIGKSVDALTDQEKKTAFVSGAMAQAKEMVEGLGDESITTADEIASLNAQMDNLTVELGEKLTPVLKNLLPEIKFIATFWADVLNNTFGDTTSIEKAGEAISGLDRMIEITQRAIDERDPLDDRWFGRREEYVAWLARSRTQLESLKLARDMDNVSIEENDVRYDGLSVALEKVEEKQMKQLDTQGKLMLARKQFNDFMLKADTELIKSSASVLGEFVGGAKASARLQQTAAIIDTYSGATAALAPPPKGAGPIAGIPLAATIILSGLANVMQISKSIGEFKAAATGMNEVVTKPTMILAGEAGAENVQITPLEGPNIDGPQGGSGVTVNISAPLLDDTVIDEIIPRIREAVVRGEDIGIS